jgi:flagellar hook-associated protein 1 FlgK
LVLGTSAYELRATPNAFDPSRVELSISTSGQTRALTAESLGGGSLSGLLQFQRDDLSAMRAQLGQLAATIGDAVNERQSLGLDLSGQAGGALFSFGDSTSLPATALPMNSNAKDASGAYVGSVNLSVTDRSALQPSDYELREDPSTPGTYMLTRQSDGEVTHGIVDGSTVDGFQIHFGSPPPQAGDRYLLEPVSTAGQLIQINQSDPRSLAAANPVTATPAASNKGTGAVDSISIQAAPAGSYQAMSLVFTSAAGAYELRDSGGGVLSSGTWSAARAITYDGIQLTLKGAPAAGDSFDIKPTTDVKTSNGNALAFVSLGTEPLIGESTFTDAFANLLANVGARVQSAQAAADTSANVASSAQATLSADTGVNLDEEAAKLIQYQQGYQAAAKILTVAQKVFDTLLSLGG